MAAWVLLAATRALTLLAPFTVVRRLLGDDPDSAACPRHEVSPTARDLARARWLGRIVQVAASRTPWRSDCYPQALTARILLRASRVPHTVTFGLRRDEVGGLRAHAWVSVGDVTVTGGSNRDWSGVATFSWAPART